MTKQVLVIDGRRCVAVEINDLLLRNGEQALTFSADLRDGEPVIRMTALLPPMRVVD